MKDDGYRFVNHYHCPRCYTRWSSSDDCTCNDRCPTCNVEIEPYKSEDLEEGRTERNALIEQSVLSSLSFGLPTRSRAIEMLEDYGHEWMIEDEQYMLEFAKQQGARKP